MVGRKFVALGFPTKLPRQGRFEKEVNEDPVVEAITADLKDGGFTLENLRWLNNRISIVRDDSQKRSRALNISRQVVDPVLGTNSNERLHEKRKAEGNCTRGENNQLVNKLIGVVTGVQPVLKPIMENHGVPASLVKRAQARNHP